MLNDAIELSLNSGNVSQVYYEPVVIEKKLSQVRGLNLNIKIKGGQ